MLDKKIILVGYSGHGYSVADVAIENQLSLLGYSESKMLEDNPFNLEYLGDERTDSFLGWKDDYCFLIGIGDNHKREKVYRYIHEEMKKQIISLVSNTASISKTVQIGNGTFINRNVTINPLARIGENVLLNTGCIIEHECIVSNSVHIAPGAVLAGNVEVGERSFIGANSVVKQGVKIGKDVIIGAGTVVLKDIPDGGKMVGNPGRLI